jgi:pilus assembly protein CpaC
MRAAPGRARATCARILLLFVAGLTLPWGAKAASLSASGAPGHKGGTTITRMVITINKSETIDLDSPLSTVSIGSTEIANLQVLNKKQIYVIGKKIGTTNISVFDDEMQVTRLIELEVALDGPTLRRKIRSITGNNTIQVSTSNDRVILSGYADNAVQADRAVSIAQSVVKAENLINAITVSPSQQVMLKVRFLEATHTGERDLGVNWYGTSPNGTRGIGTGTGVPLVSSGAAVTGGVSIVISAGALLSSGGGEPFGVVLANLVNKGANIDVMISALEKKGLMRRLAEPNLVALSGDTARFLAGGEFPVPVAVATTTGAGITPTIEFKKFGVSLAFVPTVLDRGLINLRIAPEVSELDYNNAVTLSGTTIPSLVTRNAQTTIELRDGQSFAIAGLLQTTNSRSIEQLPWLGSVPVLGALFRSSSYQKNESDLVIIVTPHLVRPGTPINHLATPLDQRLSSNDIDFFLNGQTDVPKSYYTYVTSGGEVHGPYGYIIAPEPKRN